MPGPAHPSGRVSRLWTRWVGVDASVFVEPGWCGPGGEWAVRVSGVGTPRGGLGQGIACPRSPFPVPGPGFTRYVLGIWLVLSGWRDSWAGGGFSWRPRRASPGYGGETLHRRGAGRRVVDLGCPAGFRAGIHDSANPLPSAPVHDTTTSNRRMWLASTDHIRSRFGLLVTAGSA